MSVVRFVGDVHGKIPQYLEKIKGADASIQVGDMGLGFRSTPVLPLLEDSHEFIRGNHDSPQECWTHPNHLGDYGYRTSPSLFYMSGAFSIDWMYRKPGVSWWENEELSIDDLYQAEKLYVGFRPKYVITHDCPNSVRGKLLNEILLGGFRPEKDLPSRTSTALEQMFQAYQPKIWVFGHYHIDRDFGYKGTRFICLNELSTIDLELE